MARRFGRAGLAIGMIARKEETLAAASEVLDADGIACAGVAAAAASEASLRNAIAELRTLQGDAASLPDTHQAFWLFCRSCSGSRAVQFDRHCRSRFQSKLGETINSILSI
jgi:hypothetical protein